VARLDEPAGQEKAVEEDEEEYPSTPWHFKLLLLALVLYLAFRAVQMSMWAFDRLF
jgi:hypothetical protein